ncbi:MAG: U32 family peptidase [archaeon]|jgi:collagenase-like PrtC family protease
MEITAPTNWDYKLLKKIHTINNEKNTKTKIKEVYSSIKRSITGSARTASLIPFEVDQEYAEKYIKKTHELGLDFNYLVNSSSLSNNEYNPKYRKALVDYLKWIESTKSDYITVANPFLIDLIIKHTKLKVVLSCVTDPRSVNRANILKNDGVDRIVLSTPLNRNIKLLEKIKKSTSCKLEILANESCLFDCPYRSYHYLISSIDSQKETKVTTFDYCLIKCSIAKLTDFSQIIKSPWIRPEDVNKYSDLGIEYLKLSGRIMPTNWIKNCVKAYAKNEYKGNLWDLIDQQKMYSKDFSEFINNKKFKELNIYLDNKKLKGFLDKIISSKVECGQDCKTCKLCEQTAKKTIKINKAEKEKHLTNLKIVFEKAIKIE